MDERNYHFLITGHGTFATGMVQALTMITGQLSDVTVVPFMEESVHTYREQIAEVFQECQKPLICFTDLLGGTPYKTCVEFSLKQEQVAVLSGTNLGMLVEASILRSMMADLDELCQQLVATGRENISFFQLESSVTPVTEGI